MVCSFFWSSPLPLSSRLRLFLATAGGVEVEDTASKGTVGHANQTAPWIFIYDTPDALLFPDDVQCWSVDQPLTELASIYRQCLLMRGVDCHHIQASRLSYYSIEQFTQLIDQGQLADSIAVRQSLVFLGHCPLRAAATLQLLHHASDACELIDAYDVFLRSRAGASAGEAQSTPYRQQLEDLCTHKSLLASVLEHSERAPFLSGSGADASANASQQIDLRDHLIAGLRHQIRHLSHSHRWIISREATLLHRLHECRDRLTWNRQQLQHSKELIENYRALMKRLAGPTWHGTIRRLLFLVVHQRR